MKTVINSYNHIQNNFFIRKELNEKDIQNDKTAEVTISYQTKEKIENVNLKIVDSTPKTIVNIDSQMIIQLQEFQDSTTSSIPLQKTNDIKDDIDFNGIPRFSWLKGRDDKLYNRYMKLQSNGINYIKKNDEIIERTINDTVISEEDYTTIQGSINGFDFGVFLELDRETTTDPIVHKVLDYKKTKSLEYINQLKQFLATKTKEPEIETFKLKNLYVKTDTNPQQIVSSNRETIELLDFLAKDLKWYEWFLKVEKENHTSIYSLKIFSRTKFNNVYF